MKHSVNSLYLLLIIFAFNNINAQSFEKKEFKQANTIIVFVGDSTMEQAKERFTSYLDGKGFHVYTINKQKESPVLGKKGEKSFQLNQTNDKPKLMSNNSISGDTINTALVSLYDMMMGQYSARLKFYSAKDKSGKLYIAVTGFVSSNAFGADFFDLQMQKGGKSSNWAQRELFKKMNEYLLQYEDENEIMYSAD
ncbi:MAG: hypothetical protein A2W85_10365 [Bacteroidetes bacterium GWF2_41_31]|nr:MAG: hypothetical protein A2W85_10365 [Bacteroidetes bacterium GWF2_41_31]